jgi:hypothetical protein
VLRKNQEVNEREEPRYNLCRTIRPYDDKKCECVLLCDP